MEIFAGLRFQIKQLKDRLKAMDTSKKNQKEVKEVVDALNALEERYEKERAKRDEKRKSKAETPATEAPASEPSVEKEPRPVPTGEGGIQLEWHTGGLTVELEIAPGVIVPDSLKKHDEIVERKEKELGPAIIGDKKEEADLLKFAVDDQVEPVRGAPGSKGRIMRHDNDKALAYVMWEEGPMKDKEEFGGYYPHELKKIVPSHNPGPEHKCPECDKWREKEAITLKSDLKSNYEALLKDLKDEREAHYNQGNHAWVARLDQKIKDLEQSIAEKFGNEKQGAEFGQHGNGNGLDDLYVLPSSPEEGAKIVEFLKQSGHMYEFSMANVKGHPWFGKRFIEIPFGESMKDEIAKIQNSKQGSEENGSGGTERLTVKDYTKPESNSSANADGGKDGDSEYADQLAAPSGSDRNLNSSKKTAKQYDIVNKEGKPVMTVKSTKELSMEQLSHIYEVESKKGNKNVQATLKEDLAFLKKGDSVSILAFDKVKGRVKFAHIKEGVRGWCPASKIDIKALDATTVKHGDHADKVLGQTTTETLIDCSESGPTWVPSQGLMNENRPPATPESLHEEPEKEVESAQNFQPGTKARISGGSGIDSDKIVTIADPSLIETDERRVPTNVSGAYKPIDWKREVAFQYDDGSIGTMFKNRLMPIENTLTSEVKCPKCKGVGLPGHGSCPECGGYATEMEERKKTAGNSNSDVAEMFISDSFPKDKMPVWGSKNLKITKQPNGWALVNYQTPILYRQNGSHTIYFNITKYSQTTSTIQNALRRMMAGGDVQEVDEGGIRQAIDEKPVTTKPEEHEALQRSLPPVIEDQRMDVNDPAHTLEQTSSLDKEAIIVERDGKFCVRSPKNKNWNGGCYSTREKAEQRLKTVEYFKHVKGLLVKSPSGKVYKIADCNFDTDMVNLDEIK